MENNKKITFAEVKKRGGCVTLGTGSSSAKISGDIMGFKKSDSTRETIINAIEAGAKDIVIERHNEDTCIFDTGEGMTKDKLVEALGFLKGDSPGLAKTQGNYHNGAKYAVLGAFDGLMWISCRDGEVNAVAAWATDDDTHDVPLRILNCSKQAVDVSEYYTEEEKSYSWTRTITHDDTGSWSDTKGYTGSSKKTQTFMPAAIKKVVYNRIDGLGQVTFKIQKNLASPERDNARKDRATNRREVLEGVEKRVYDKGEMVPLTINGEKVGTVFVYKKQEGCYSDNQKTAENLAGIPMGSFIIKTNIVNEHYGDDRNHSGIMGQSLRRLWAKIGVSSDLMNNLGLEISFDRDKVLLVNANDQRKTLNEWDKDNKGFILSATDEGGKGSLRKVSLNDDIIVKAVKDCLPEWVWVMDNERLGEEKYKASQDDLEKEMSIGKRLKIKLGKGYIGNNGCGTVEGLGVISTKGKKTTIPQDTATDTAAGNIRSNSKKKRATPRVERKARVGQAPIEIKLNASQKDTEKNKEDWVMSTYSPDGSGVWSVGYDEESETWKKYVSIIADILKERERVAEVYFHGLIIAKLRMKSYFLKDRHEGDQKKINETFGEFSTAVTEIENVLEAAMKNEKDFKKTYKESERMRRNQEESKVYTASAS